MIKEYIIIKALDPEELCRGVMVYIKKGYQPHGSVSVDNGIFYQAMITLDNG